MSEKDLNSDNVRVYGSMDDAVHVAPLSAEFPDVDTLEDLLKAFPEPWGNLGWLLEDGIPLTVDTNVEDFNGHQGGSLLRSKVTSTKKSVSLGCAEESPLVTQLFFDHGAPTAQGASGELARVDLPKGIGTVAVKAIIITRDDDVTKAIFCSRLEIGERDDVSHSNSELTGYTMSAALVGETYILTNSKAYKDAIPAPAGP